MRTRLGRTAVDRPQRTRFGITDDLAVVGVSNVISLPGGQLQTILGVEETVDQALTSGALAELIAAQQRIASSGLRSRYTERRTAAVVSVADDGSALILNPL
jgi:hypothetical protein